MALDIEELKRRAKDYVEREAHTEVESVSFVETFTLLGQEDVVLEVTTTEAGDTEWWVVGGSTPMNLYSKKRIRTADEAFSFHTGIMLRMQDRSFRESPEPPDDVGYDAFISHASEDKDSVARPLAESLKALGFWIWYDEFSLEVGNSLRESIDHGLVNSRYGIVILSPSFFSKRWPQYELNGLTARDIEGTKVILPVWHDVEKKDVLLYSPPLADRLALSTSSLSIQELARKLANVLARD